VVQDRPRDLTAHQDVTHVTPLSLTGHAHSCANWCDLASPKSSSRPLRRTPPEAEHTNFREMLAVSCKWMQEGGFQMKKLRLASYVTFCSALLLLVAMAAVYASAETVLLSKRIGNNSEGVVYVTTGRWTHHAVAIDGNDVIAIELTKTGNLDFAAAKNSDGLQGNGWRKIFDVLPFGAGAAAPKGIVFIPGQNEFVFGANKTTNLFHTDQFGNPLAPIVLSGLANPDDFQQYEGLTWVPRNAPKHPNTIAAILIRRSDGLAHVIYIRPDGTVEAEVLPQPGTPVENYLCGIGYQPQRPGTFVVTSCGGENDIIDEDGNFLGVGPTAPANSGDIESAIVDRFGTVYLGGYDGHLYAYDSTYNRRATQDRSYVIGLGTPAASVTWNPDTQKFLLLSNNNVDNLIYEVSPALDAKRQLFVLDPVRASSPTAISYLGNGQVAVGVRYFPRGIEVLNLSDGSEVERLVFLPPTYPGGRLFQTVGVGAFGPDNFLVRVPGDDFAFKVVSRDGTVDNSVLPNAILPTRLPDIPANPSVIGNSAQVFDNGYGSGTRIFTGAAFYDISGNLLYQIDQNAIGITPGLGIQGTWVTGNIFAVVEGGTSKVIIFTVP
jgi:hypothetical protein